MSIMGLTDKILQRVKGRITTLRKHRTVTFIEIHEQFLNKKIQIKANPPQHGQISGSGSSIEAVIDPTDENAIVDLIYQQKAEV